MLRLKRVEMQGFKSFCDRTELRFNGAGMAAVVGPNGCGKSNLSDAISWVLGEQSAKSLRGARMEDVIFAGTRDRKPVGMAQVTLVMVDPLGQTDIPGVKPEHHAAPANGQTKSNGKGHANGTDHANGHTPSNGTPAFGKPVLEAAEAQEITITRRLYRSGESEYLINGKHTRLRDIQELFMGTGLGPESYAIIEQGRIGQILSSKPLDRRSVIEEAAGIGKYKTKRRLAEGKLEGAKQNLTRVFDILEEVGRQVNSLKRQAAKAKRYEELKGEFNGQLKLALTGRYRVMDREATRVALELNLASQSCQELNARVEVDEKSLAEARQALYQVEGELTQSRKRLSDLQLEAERTRGQMESQARQIAGMEQRLQQGETEGGEMERRLRTMEEERKSQMTALEELRQKAGDARQRLAAKNAERETLQQNLSQRERALEQSRQQVVRLLGEASSLKNQLGQIEAFMAAMERDTARVTRDEQSAAADLERLAAARQQFSERLSERQLQLENIGDQRKRVEGDLAERRHLAQQNRQTLDVLRNEASRLKARRDSLEEILSHRAYTTESVKRLFTAVDRGEAHDLKPAGVLADFVELKEARFEKATEEFLHEELEYVVVREWDEAQRGIELLRADLDGRATFLVEPKLGDPTEPSVEVSYSIPEPSMGPETGIVGRLSEGLRFTNGLTNAPAALLPRLARCFLAENRESAQRLAVQYPDLYFLLADGVCYHGRAVSGGKKTGSGPLALKRELRELTGLVQSKTNALAITQEELTRLDADIHKLGEELERLRTEQQRQEKETLALDHEMRKVSEEYNRAGQRVSVSRLELERLTRDAEKARGDMAAKLALVEEKERIRHEQEQAFEAGRAEAQQLRIQAAHLGEEHSIVRVEVAGLEERRRGLESAVERIEHQFREVARRRQELTGEMERIGVARTRLLESNMQLDERAGALAQEVSGVEGAVARLAAAELTQREGLTAREEELKLLRQTVSEGLEKRSQIEIDLVRRRSDLAHLDETSRRDLGSPVAELASDEEVQPDEIAVAEAEDRVADLRRRIEALGPVNAEALVEYQEAQNRYEFLNTQRQDLLDSIRDTEKAIQDIDTESKKRFSEAFHVINEHFKQMFVTLFGGGTGEMRLTGEGDVLDAGIEIVAQPPGKRLQNVLLLSGGEKALTAVSLLMAIFRYSPSPFCILDEVDAPLDEANVGRFTRLIKEMSRHTQFIVITHAKKTMEAAEALYGVTMQEQGVSKLVSVKFQGAPPPPPPQPQAQMALA